VNGSNVKVNVDCAILDAPATSFALKVSYFNAYNACFKCTTEGEFDGRMSYPELTAPLRTDESFVNQEHSSYHQGRTILESIPRFGCISNVPLDYMRAILRLGGTFE